MCVRFTRWNKKKTMKECLSIVIRYIIKRQVIIMLEKNTIENEFEHANADGLDISLSHRCVDATHSISADRAL